MEYSNPSLRVSGAVNAGNSTNHCSSSATDTSHLRSMQCAHAPAPTWASRNGHLSWLPADLQSRSRRIGLLEDHEQCRPAVQVARRPGGQKDLCVSALQWY